MGQKHEDRSKHCFGCCDTSCLCPINIDHKHLHVCVQQHNSLSIIIICIARGCFIQYVIIGTKMSWNKIHYMKYYGFIYPSSSLVCINNQIFSYTSQEVYINNNIYKKKSLHLNHIFCTLGSSELYTLINLQTKTVWKVLVRCHACGVRTF